MQGGYFGAWQNVSMALQKALRQAIPEFYFRVAARYADRESAYPLLVYTASRICRGRPRTEFTYDVADPEALPCALHLIGRSLQAVLARIEARLHQAGRPELARRYAPVWHEDVLRAVRKKPRPLIGLIGDEAALINGDGARNRHAGARRRCAPSYLMTSVGYLTTSTYYLTTSKASETSSVLGVKHIV
jgi:hypothetical protein